MAHTNSFAGMGDASSARQGSEPPAFDRVSIDLIDSSREQLRRTVNRSSLDELVQSIRDHGVLQPIRLRRQGDRYEVVAGHRRLMASRMAGLTDVPAAIVDANDGQALVEGLIENIQREDLNPVERGEALRRLRVNLGAQSWEEVGRVIGISRRHVYHLLNVAELPEPIREDIQAGVVSEKHGRALLRLRKHPELQVQLWRRITSERVPGDEALHLASELAAEREAGGERQEATPRSSELDDAVHSLLRLLPRASMRDIRPLQQSLELLSRRLNDLLVDAFYAEEESRTVAAAAPGVAALRLHASTRS